MQQKAQILNLGAFKMDFGTFAWLVFAYNVLVILWGAWVRITGSGAGCGDHWPLCNGEVVPLSPSVHTVIELTHRVTSALCGVWAIGLLVWAYRAYPRKHPVRGLSWLHLGLVLFEGFLGAVLIKQEWVGQDDSFGRACSCPCTWPTPCC